MSIKAWIQSSCSRLYPASNPGSAKTFELAAALNERSSFQVGLRQPGPQPLKLRLQAEAPAGVEVCIRRVGYVPVPHLTTPANNETVEYEGEPFIPGFVPDPLFPENTLLLPPNETHAFWITLRPKRSNTPGVKNIRLKVVPENGKAQPLSARVKYFAVAPRGRKNFQVTHWFYANALFDWYQTAFSDARFWPILEGYFRNMVDHGQNVIYIPALTPPINGDTRPCQLLKIRKNRNSGFELDWSDVRRYVRLAKECGFTHFEWNHLFSQWGVKHPLRVYEGQGETEKLLVDVKGPSLSRQYRDFLKQYLPQLKRFVDAEDILKKSYFHLSDEPHGDEHRANYKAARLFLQEKAPWMKIMDALSQIEFAREKLTDLPVAVESNSLAFIAENIPVFNYYCCQPKGGYLNHFLDTPLTNVAMHGFLHYRWPFKGFLHWGYNYWSQANNRKMINPFMVSDAERWPHWAYGDPFLVYPGDNGPLDSIRWEIFAEAMQDYALLQHRGVDRNAPFLKTLRAFDDFPKSEAWRKKVRLKLLTGR